MAIFMQLLPLLLPVLSPILTALIEKLFVALNIPPPPQIMPLVNGAVGIVLATIGGAPPPVAVLAGPLGAAYGNRVREAHNKVQVEAAKKAPPVTLRKP